MHLKLIQLRDYGTPSRKLIVVQSTGVHKNCNYKTDLVYQQNEALFDQFFSVPLIRLYKKSDLRRST